MKKLGAGFAVVGVFLMIAVGCNSSSDDAKSTTREKYNTRATEALVREVRVGMTEQEVRELLGEPDSIMPSSKPGAAGWVYQWGSGGDDGTMVAFLDGKVYKLPWIGNNPQ